VELNHLFLFIAVASPVVVLIRVWRSGEAAREWRIPAFVVLAITALSWIVVRDMAGFIGAGAWFILLLIPAIGSRKVVDLTSQHRYKLARHLAVAIQAVHPSTELREYIQLLRRLESEQTTTSGSAYFRSQQSFVAARKKDRPRRFRHAPAVTIFIILNIVAFVIEISVGNWNDFITLHRLGALEPWQVVVRGEYWRLVTALFLHAGVTHLFFNLFALYVLGPGLERAIGSLRFAICYFISGIGSSAGVVALWRVGLTNPGQLVGASGCIMGIVGAWAAFLIQHRHMPRAWERLRNIVLIIGIQIVFDLTTPQVSTAAHICGLVTGFGVGALVARRETRSP